MLETSRDIKGRNTILESMFEIVSGVFYWTRARNERKKINEYIHGIIYSPTVMHLLRAYLLLDGDANPYSLQNSTKKIHSYVHSGRSRLITVMRTNLHDMRFNI